jgi:hypothetical protein
MKKITLILILLTLFLLKTQAVIAGPTQNVAFWCDAGYGEKSGVDTALGCIPIDSDNLTPWIISRALMIGGGIAFILLVYAGFQILTASGNPARMQAGRELITSVVAGLAVIIFAIFILQLFGVRVFRIPGILAPSGPLPTPGIIAVVNSATNRHCSDICQNDYPGRTCTGVSTDSDTTNPPNGRYWYGDVPNCRRDNAGCSTVMGDNVPGRTGNVCRSYQTYWTWCFCQ